MRGSWNNFRWRYNFFEPQYNIEEFYKRKVQNFKVSIRWEGHETILDEDILSSNLNTILKNFTKEKFGILKYQSDERAKKPF